jgi:two-component system heavy metal sensor histidine kinase CusS
MSSKIAGERRPWSIALRLTVWYAISGFVLTSAVTGYLYWMLTRHLAKEDDEWLVSTAARIRERAVAHSEDEIGLRQEVTPTAVSVSEPMHIRVRTGKVTVETPGMAALLPSEVFPPEGQFGNRGGSTGEVFRLRTEMDSSGDVLVQVAMNRASEEELLAEYRQQIGYILAVSVIACASGGYLIARRGLRPLANVAQTARRIRPGHLDERLVTHGLPSEVRALADTFNEMLDRLEDAFGRLSQFSADLAHELRTPVNILRGEAEVALGRARTPEEYREVLGSCLEECGRLGRMIESLLFLARAENPKTEVSASPLDVARELNTIREFFDATAGECGVQLIVEAESELQISADRNLLQRAVGNLVSNAIAHTPRGGKVTLRSIRDCTGIVIEVADTGEGIAAIHLPHVFDRFYRADVARSSGGGRVGLGLAIVKGVVELHGGSVTAESVLGSGTRIAMLFPDGLKMTKT